MNDDSDTKTFGQGIHDGTKTGLVVGFVVVSLFIIVLVLSKVFGVVVP